MATAARRAALRIAPSLSIQPSASARCHALHARSQTPVLPRRTLSSTPAAYFPRKRQGKETTNQERLSKLREPLQLDSKVFDDDITTEDDSELDFASPEMMAAKDELESMSESDRKEMEEMMEEIMALDPQIKGRGSSDDSGLDAEGMHEAMRMFDHESLKHQRQFPDQVEIEEEPKFDDSLISMGEQEGVEDDHWENDDITTKGHGMLEQVREIRQYARWAAWELPLLSKFAQPFELPKQSEPLRFRYTTYLGESHPAARKVVVQFHLKDLPGLNEDQRNKLIHLLGPRYNPQTETAKMSCEAFETPTQNKRYLSDTIDTLLKEAKDGKDQFKDLPFDFRHHKPKVNHVFPESWRVTPERKQQIEEGWAKLQKIEDIRREQGKLTSGQQRINESLNALAEPVPVTQSPRPKRR